MSKQHGFTLMEMVVSMVIVGVISLGLINYGVVSSTLFVQTQNRISALEEARFVLSRFHRELGNSVPLSTRVSSDGDCIEYIPLTYVGEYDPDNLTLGTNSLPLTHPLSSALDQCFADANNPCLVSIYPRRAEDLYQGENSSNQVYRLTGADTQSLKLGSVLNVRPTSPSNRLFVYLPIARQFCAINDEVRFFPGYPLTFEGLWAANSQNDQPVAKHLASHRNIFRLGVDGTYSSTASMHFSLQVNHDNENVEFMQNVQVLNAQ
ncbi:PilW family protein [Vibrio sp. LaRot3]|uniref:PilW family protein n=1 Tax=Vibrio sp. LaRot3 TaxID=2998829 RepID=UPI0022CDEFE0|nr:prepilin-type N-terminal cleavage/methylation domain-containing protein [Vibrio sp. LaRot3]MDA0147874.1 prepilin-type N-terminal cleavage/methylation domain-containing protein [Vibrio sp. LaRot3]